MVFHIRSLNTINGKIVGPELRDVAIKRFSKGKSFFKGQSLLERSPFHTFLAIQQNNTNKKSQKETNYKSQKLFCLKSTTQFFSLLK